MAKSKTKKSLASIRKRVILERGQRVVWRSDPERKGIIVTAGVEVSEVKWDDGTFRFFSNEQFKKE